MFFKYLNLFCFVELMMQHSLSNFLNNMHACRIINFIITLKYNYKNKYNEIILLLYMTFSNPLKISYNRLNSLDAVFFNY